MFFINTEDYDFLDFYDIDSVQKNLTRIRIILENRKKYIGFKTGSRIKNFKAYLVKKDGTSQEAQIQETSKTTPGSVASFSAD